jgi:hypothetical protein
MAPPKEESVYLTGKRLQPVGVGGYVVLGAAVAVASVPVAVLAVVGLVAAVYVRFAVEAVRAVMRPAGVAAA